MAHFNIDLEPILARAVELDVKHVRPLGTHDNVGSVKQQ